jgi:phospholipid/cholesterol/gamma-HCH transport system substrate-binding protein
MVSDYETTQKRRNLVVGVFVIVGICALIWLIFKFGDLPVIVTKLDSFEVNVQFPSASGVQRDTPVRFCGYQIGRVINVMAPEERKDLITGRVYHQTVVILAIDKRYADIPSNVKVKLMTRGLGSSYIDLKVNPNNLPAPPLDPNNPQTRYLMNNMWLQGSTGMTSEFFPEESQKKLSELIDGLGNFIKNANDIIGGQENKDNIAKTLANMAKASEEAVQTLDEFQKFADSGTSTLKNADAKIEEVAKAIIDTGKEFQDFATTATSTTKNIDAKADKLIAAMVDTSENLSEAASQLRMVLEKINNGQGSAAKFLNDGQFYENLIEDTEQLQTLLQDLKLLIDKVHENGLRSIL